MDIHKSNEPENPETFEQVKALLETNDIKFTLLIHEPTKTSEESAKVRNVSLASGAKAMLLWKKTKTQENQHWNSNKEQFVLAVMSAEKKLSWKQIRKQLNYKQLDMATPEQVKQMTGCISGAVPPFGSLFSVQTYLDPSLINQGEQINFNAGLRTHSIGMTIEDFLKIEKPQILEFVE